MRPASKNKVNRREKALSALVRGQDTQGHRRAHQEVMPPMTFSAHDTSDVNRSAEAIARALACGRLGCSCGKRQGQGWRTHCPAHSDGTPSLDVADGEGGKLLVHCFGGCPQETVIAALRERGLWPQTEPLGVALAELAAAKGLALDFLKGLGWRDGHWHGTEAVLIPYLGASGSVLFNRYRIRLRGPDHYRQPKAVHLAPYGLNRVEEARRSGRIVLVEGETDAATLWSAAIPALGVPGAGAWRADYMPLLDGVIVYLWREPDAGGDKLASAVASCLPSARIIEAPADAKDSNALFLALGRDLDAFRQRMQELIASARPASELRAEAASRDAEEALQRSGGLLDRPDLLGVVGQAVRDLGYAGDLRKPVLLYLAITSRLLRQPVNIAAYGPSAAGKNFTADTIARLFPSAAIYDATASSERAWVYTDEDFRHRFIIIGESAALHRDGVGASILRSVAWGGRIAYDTVEKTADGLRGRRIEKEGPTGIITTATKPLEGELATRFLSIEIPDDPDQTRAVLAATAERANGAQSTRDLGPVVAVQEWLQLAGAAVSVPFAHRLAELFPAQMVRARRDFTQLLTLIQAHALLHQRQRRRDEGGRVVAELADYRAVYDLAVDVFAALSAGGVTNAIRETVEKVATLYQVGQPVSVPALAASLGLHRSTVYRRAVRACDLSYLVNAETREGRPLKLEPGEPLPEERAALPHPEDLGAVVCVIPPANACNRATEGFGQIGAKYGSAVAQADATRPSVAATATPPATAPATELADTEPDMDKGGGCTVAVETRGYDTPLPHYPPDEVDDAVPPELTGQRHYLVALGASLGFPRITWPTPNGPRPADGIPGDRFHYEQAARLFTDADIEKAVAALEGMAAPAGATPQ